ncbi:hypothetical protein DPMN_189864 [Dreissena polymorpha]|uniref:Adhesin domain-containing protein n=1 Tax=Dreissena polymorpha TaxID=45954 RepID=A0A9D4DUU6_DREPO|nr:hypothetical protein DPMN_189864 [Dreissena polymorpha]
MPEINSLTVSQSVECPLTSQDTGIISWNVNAANGRGTGSFTTTYRRLLANRGTIQVSSGRGTIQVRSGRGTMQVRSGRGTMQVRNVRGTIQVSSCRGTIQVSSETSVAGLAFHQDMSLCLGKQGIMHVRTASSQISLCSYKVLFLKRIQSMGKVMFLDSQCRL